MQNYLEQKIKEIQEYIDTHDDLTEAEKKALENSKKFMNNELLTLVDSVS